MSAHRCLLVFFAADPTAPEYALIPSSPRSVESCFRLGIDPIELQFHPVEWYKRAGEDDDIAQIRYERNENVRQVRAARRGRGKGRQGVVRIPYR